MADLRVYDVALRAQDIADIARRRPDAAGTSPEVVPGDCESGASCRVGDRCSVGSCAGRRDPMSRPRPADCLPGSYPVAVGEVSNGTAVDDCAACAPGTSKSATGSDRCTRCQSGAMANMGHSECEQCPLNHLSAGALEGGLLPSVATFADGSKQEYGPRYCWPCPPHTFSDIGAASCRECQPGTRRLGNETTCQPCAQGSFSETGICVPCQQAEGISTIHVGTASRAGCVCPRGTYLAGSSDARREPPEPVHRYDASCYMSGLWVDHGSARRDMPVASGLVSKVPNAVNGLPAVWIRPDYDKMKQGYLEMKENSALSGNMSVTIMAVANVKYATYYSAIFGQAPNHVGDSLWVGVSKTGSFGDPPAWNEAFSVKHAQMPV